MSASTPRTPRPLLEVCVGSLDDALAAQSAGADRLEVCGALELGGLTPSIGLVEQVVGEVDLPIVAMLRPRAAGFAYSRREFECMRKDAIRLLDAGVQGIVFGVLNESGAIDDKRVAELVSIAGENETVFHRAFDGVEQSRSAIERLAAWEVTRVLTSGGASNAMEGLDALRRLVTWAGGQVEIMAGGSVAPNDVNPLLAEAGCAAIHIGAATSRFDPSMTPARSAALCDWGKIRSGAWRAVNPNRVADVRRAMARLGGATSARASQEQF